MSKHKVVLVRHGQSQWNLENRFTGWIDVDLAAEGFREAKSAARMLEDGGYEFDVAYTSLLKRAIRTLWILLDELDCMWLPVYRAWQLNERHYGALQGLDKIETTRQHGESQVHLWRRGYDVRPPALSAADDENPALHRRYADIPRADVPLVESLQDTVDRVIPYWERAIVPQVKGGRRVMICAHGNSLRALVKHLDRISNEDIAEVNIPTGIPLVYELDERVNPTDKYYLGDPSRVEQAVASVAAQARAER